MLIEITYNVTDVFMSTTETPVYVEISFEQPGGSAAVWGSITGTLSNQTDLQNALNAKLDESTIDGGTEGQILVKNSATDFDFAWINNYAKYLATNVRNQTGSTIGAFQVVYISGATGNKPLISLADADTEATSSKTYGVTATSIANNGTGDVVTAGELSGINTSAFNEGDLLWLSTTAGGVVTSPPAEPAHAVFIGYVVRSHPTLGTIDVSIQNGYELNELHGVQITTPTDNQGLFYNSSNSLWENKTISTALGYTPVPTTRSITINGVTYDLSADRTWTIAAGISGSGASGQVTYWTGASAVSGSADFTWNGNNLVLGNNKGLVLSQAGTNRSISLLAGNILDNYAGINIYPSAGTNVGNAIQVIPRGTGFNANIKSGITVYNTDFVADSTNYELAVFRAGGANYSISTGKAGTGTTRPLLLSAGFATDAVTNGNQLWLYTSGNVGINTSSDPAVRFGVVGDTLLRGSGNTSATTALTVQNSSSTNLFRVRNDGNTFTNAGCYIGTSNANTIIPSDANNSFSASGLNLNILFGSFDTAGFGVSIQGFNSGTRSATSGASGTLNIAHGFAPTSGTGTYTMLNIVGTINQTGGANGITRGLYVNPTLTAAADFRAIETTAGNVLFGSNFFWDNANSQLTLSVNANTATSSVRGLKVINTNSTGYANTLWQNDTTDVGQFMMTGTAGAIAGTNILARQANFINAGGTGGINLYASAGNISFLAGSGSVSRMVLFQTGNLSIGTTSDIARLGVVGDTLLRGSGATSATTALRIQNSASSSLLLMRNDGVLELGGVDAGPFMYPITTSNAVGISGTNLGFYSLTTTQATDVGTYSFNGANLAQTSGNVRNVHIYRNFQPTSGTATYSGLSIFDTINQTGGANGITRGLYVNPTLTSAADFRAIETTAGNVLIGTNANQAAGVFITNSSTGNNQRSVLRVINNTGENGTFSVWGSATGLPNKTLFESSKDFIIGTDSNTASGGTSKFQIYVGGYNAVTSPQLSFHATANLSIGSTADNGQRLQVYGDTLLRGSGATNATTALTVQNSSSTNLFTVRNDGVMAQGGGADASINLYMQKGLSGSVYPGGIYMNGIISSTSTSGATYFTSDANTQAASFTLPRLEHFKVRQGVIGAGSTINNQYGFFVESTLNGATNNYGFWGDIAAGTGRWNLYMNGTANNYLAGNLGIGTLAQTATFLILGASTTAKSSIRLLSGTAPTSPNDGDIWFDGTDIKMRIGGVTKTFTLI